jgi:hypothetical protein
MDVRYPTIAKPATPEYVLAVIRDMHRQQCQYDPEADPSSVLSFDTTVAEWRDACDLLGWRKLGRAYNQLWGISCSDAEWRAVLEPARQGRLADVCRLIASRAVRPLIRPSRLSGTGCVPAGAFLTIRSLLHEAGAAAGGDCSIDAAGSLHAAVRGGIPRPDLRPGARSVTAGADSGTGL